MVRLVQISSFTSGTAYMVHIFSSCPMAINVRRADFPDDLSSSSSSATRHVPQLLYLARYSGEVLTQTIYIDLVTSEDGNVSVR